MIALLAIVAFGGVGLLARGIELGPPPGGPKGPGPASAPETAPIVVTTEPAVTRPIQRTVCVVGSLYGRDEVSVSTKMEGRIRSIRHDVGDEVKPGEVLAELDPVDAELTLAEAQKGLELELAKLGLKEPPAEGFDIDTLPSVVRAAAREKYIVSKHQRQVTASGRGAGSPEDLSQAEFDLRDAKEAHRQAKIDAETTLASVRQRQAAVDTARQRLADLFIRVPVPTNYTFGGPVTYLLSQRMVSEGEMVRTLSGGLFKLVVADSLKLQAAVPERYLGEIKVGQRVEVRVEAYQKVTFPGAVARVNPTVERASRTFQVEVAVPNGDRKLAPGCFAKAEVQTRLDPDVVLVPEEALVQYAGVTKVFVVQGGKARAAAVRSSNTRVEADKARYLAEVSGEIRAGDRVVTTGQANLTDGAAVRERTGGSKGGSQ
jgi:RND family efflux transporter MFP subunit